MLKVDLISNALARESPSTMKWTPKRIRHLRKQMGLTQSEMADKLGYGSYQRVSELENGKREAPATIQRLLDMLEQQAEEEEE